MNKYLGLIIRKSVKRCTLKLPRNGLNESCQHRTKYVNCKYTTRRDSFQFDLANIMYLNINKPTYRQTFNYILETSRVDFQNF